MEARMVTLSVQAKMLWMGVENKLVKAGRGILLRKSCSKVFQKSLVKSWKRRNQESLWWKGFKSRNQELTAQFSAKVQSQWKRSNWEEGKRRPPTSWAKMKKMVDFDWMWGLEEEERRITWQGLGHFFHFLVHIFLFFRRPDFLAKLDDLMEPNENPWLRESQVSLKSKLIVEWKLGGGCKIKSRGRKWSDGAISRGENIKDLIHFDSIWKSWLKLTKS